MRARLDYGQISKIDVLPVTEARHLRAESKKRGFARNGELHFTGRFQKSLFCP
ncbi:vitamin B12-binding protein [Ligilactobacillus ruminis]|uniref:Vitamin B12-binding protein n=1 Tax=Ligilactobacillus ruminis TaxID=1623 RepID=A0A8B2Z658_9LACO|nr:vitamin B12-binding protein [Ligilactobacillus ruminis]